MAATELRTYTLVGVLILAVCFLLYMTFSITFHPKTGDSQNARTVDGVRALPKKNILRSQGDKSQFFQIGRHRIFVIAPFYDSRFNEPTIRFFGMQNQDSTKVLKLICRFDSVRNGTISKTIDVPVVQRDIFYSWPNPKAKSLAYFYFCPLGNKSVALETVEVLVKGEATGVRLPIVHVRAKKGAELALCMKCTHGMVDPYRLVEWIEFNHLLGVGKFIMYDMAIQGVARRVLDYYKKRGLVEIIPYRFPLTMFKMSQDYWHTERDTHVYEQSFLVSLNDCFYRNHKNHRFIIVIDLDEVIIPTNSSESLVHVAERASQEYPHHQSLTFRTVHHALHYGKNWTGSRPSTLFMQNMLLRTPVSEVQVKSILQSKNTVSINWHASVIHNPQRELLVLLNDTSYGTLHHFRNIRGWADMEKFEKPYTADTRIPEYRDVLEKKVYQVLRALRSR